MGSPPPTSTTAPGSPPATTLVTRLDVGLSVSSAADVVISFAVEPGTSGLPGVRCQSTWFDAGSSTTPVNVPGTASAGFPSAVGQPGLGGHGRGGGQRAEGEAGQRGLRVGDGRRVQGRDHRRRGQRDGAAGRARRHQDDQQYDRTAQPPTGYAQRAPDPVTESHHGLLCAAAV